MMKKLDDANAIQVTEDIWWVGFADYEAGFSNNPYLLIDGDEAVLFDPGPGHPVFRDVILRKIQQVTAPDRIRYVIVHHQDPDLCGLLPYLENLLHPDAVVVTHPRAALFLPYYGIRKSVLPVGDEDVLELRSGRRLTIYHVPYLHFSGNILTYDERTRSVFSADIFAVFNRDWDLYADETYLPLVKSFLNHYTDNEEAIRYAYDLMQELNIDRVLPQHGGIIEGQEAIEVFLEALLETEPGELLRELKNKPDAEQKAFLLERGKAYLQAQIGEAIEADSVEALLNVALSHNPGMASDLIDTMDVEAEKLGVTNPLTYGRTHRADALQTVESTKIAEAVRRRYLSRQYGISSQEHASTESVLQYGLLSFKAYLGVMFVDIRSFTAWSAERTPDEIVSMLNQQLEVISKLINANGGRVNKVLGDGLMAYFPEERLSDCVRVAQSIHQAVTEDDLLPVGIGCDVGEVTMGDIGEEARLDYTLIGRPVNCASRLCDSAAAGEVVLSSQFIDRIEGLVKEQIWQQDSFQAVVVQAKEHDPETPAVRFTPACV
jgi:class 3 adenylate cyclase/glyoxylase-like metal-dependent hydrolase (beta-lactamase superfamily II)